MIYIRVDMNTVIATGHVMRCMAIAKQIMVRGENVTFILSDRQAVEILKANSMNFHVLNVKWNDKDSEIIKIKNYLYENCARTMLVDSYQVTEKYLSELSQVVNVMYIDDLKMMAYPVASIVCYMSYWKKLGYEISENDKNLIGTKFAPLRQEFMDCEKKIIHEHIEKVMILSGGTDQYGVIEQLLEKISFMNYKEIYVVCGRYYANYKALKEKYGNRDDVFLYKAVENVIDYMKECDLVISAGGTTLYELCAIGTPTISYALADNQLDNVYQFAEDDIIDYAGDVRKENVVENVCRLLMKNDNKELRQRRTLQMQQLVDGKGAVRIAQKIVELSEE